MSVATKEKFEYGISKEELKRYEASAESRRSEEEQLKHLTPACPDGSGELGKHDENASEWFGGAAIYRTESDKYFAKVGKNGFKMVNPLHLKSYLMYCKDGNK